MRGMTPFLRSIPWITGSFPLPPVVLIIEVQTVNK